MDEYGCTWEKEHCTLDTKGTTFAVFAVAELDRHSREDLAKSANPCPCQIHENSHPSAAPSPRDGMHVYRAPVDTGGVKALASLEFHCFSLSRGSELRYPLQTVGVLGDWHSCRGNRSGFQALQPLLSSPLLHPRHPPPPQYSPLSTTHYSGIVCMVPF